ncbi:CUX2 [Cordylochernes scorpioides]|uniref:Homeobox protein cut-like n=1 Tax=Cordylochernes scorpioides TaxID=51811 RepID=A0ABY6KFD0_9ARAC|nr:CUX2 [Cordylochernes scorpioides]
MLGFHRRVKAKTSFQDDDVPIDDDTTTKPLFTRRKKIDAKVFRDITVKKLQEKLKEYEDNLEVTLREQLKEQESQLRQEGEEQIASLAVKLEEAEKKSSTYKVLRPFFCKPLPLLHKPHSPFYRLHPLFHKPRPFPSQSSHFFLKLLPLCLIGPCWAALENSQSELMGLKSRYDEVTQSKFEELELMMSDLERANQPYPYILTQPGTTRFTAAICTPHVQKIILDCGGTARIVVDPEDYVAFFELLNRHNITKLFEVKCSSCEIKCSSCEGMISSCKRAAVAEKELSVLKERLEVGGALTAPASDRASLELELCAKEKQISHLTDDLQRLQSTLAMLKETSASKIAQLEELLAEKDRTIQALEEKLHDQRDYKEIKNELGATELPDSPGKPQQLPLEVALLEKNKTLQSENTSLKVSQAEISGFPTLQTVESFGSLLGEEIVSSFTQNLPPPPPQPVQPPPQSSMEDGGSQSDTSQSPPPTATVSQLQDLVRQRLESCSEDALNTLVIARCVRELLNAHNIGQRLFARLVLGLSQGTVSELLSKPKPWDKLTEKGRDSYRKMYAWASDEACINMLKSLLPKKGKEMFSYKQEDEERVAQILREARAAMCQQEKSQLSETRDEGGGGTKTPPKPSRRPRKYENDDIPAEMVVRIYQEELSKLMGQRVEEGYERTQEEIQQALSIYQQELARLNYHSSNSSSSSDSLSSRWKDSADPPSAFPPIIKQEPEESGGGAEDSPLQMMQSITNSLLAQATSQFSGHRPTKAVLPPITQQQFDQYKNLNTENIVKKVKEQLSQFSISQRLFGESVLGLSQGSVSDLLARPKPWHMLTQKGREPFIRMQIFLEDENAAHKLVASQYKIAPERLMRTPSFNGTPIVENVPLEHLREKSPESPQQSPLPLSVKSPMHEQPSVYEIAAMTTDLDTFAITIQIKETLIAHNIGQKLFGDSVLGLSQGSVSELLSKPKPWHLLSAKGREPFIRMQLWLRDPHNISKLKNIKNERRDVIKRGPPMSELPEYFLHQEVVTASVKKPRILFSEEQKEALRLAYAIDPYPSSETVEFLAKELGLSIRTVTNWFHNHRMRVKGSSHQPRNHVTLPHSFDPLKFRHLLGQRLAEICQQPMPRIPIESEDETLDLRVINPCAAPQRVDTSFEDDSREDEVINGVCVIQATPAPL